MIHSGGLVQVCVGLAAALPSECREDRSGVQRERCVRRTGAQYAESVAQATPHYVRGTNSSIKGVTRETFAGQSSHAHTHARGLRRAQSVSQRAAHLSRMDLFGSVRSVCAYCCSLHGARVDGGDGPPGGPRGAVRPAPARPAHPRAQPQQQLRLPCLGRSAVCRMPRKSARRIHSPSCAHGLPAPVGVADGGQWRMHTGAGACSEDRQPSTCQRACRSSRCVADSPIP